MKKRILILMGVCFMFAGCGAKSSKTLETSQLSDTEATEDVAGSEALGEQADPEGTIRTTADDLLKLPQEIKDVLFGDGHFYDVEEKKEFTRESFQVMDPNADQLTAVLWKEFLVADVDQDGEDELAVYITALDGALVDHEVRIFDLSDGTVYAHPYVFRAVAAVYENGIFIASGGAADNIWYRIQYDGEDEVQTVEAYSETKFVEEEGTSVHYYIGDEEVPEEELYEYIGKRYGINGERGEFDRILWSEENIEDVM